MGLSIFQALADIATGAKARKDAEYREFLKFYRNVVESVSTDAAAAFGNMTVKVVESSGKASDFGMLITAADYLFWKRHIESEGTRFVASPESVKRLMIERMAKKAEVYPLTPEERARIIELMV